MDAVVLAGGYATRMWPITLDRPKMFLPLGGKTVVDRIFVDLEGDDRIDRVFVSTNREFADEFRDYLSDTDFDKPQVSVEETTHEDEKFGVVGALAQLIDREDVTDDLLVVAGDNYISFDLADFVDTFERHESPTLAAYDVGSREKAKSYGLVTLDGSQVVDFQEKPDDPQSTLVSIACYAFPAETLELFEKYLAGGNNPDEPGWFIQWLHDRLPTYAFTFDGAWFDIGTPESYLDAVAYHLDGDAQIDPDARVENSTVGANVHVMAEAEVVDANLEEAVVFPNATVENATLSSSIVDEESTISGVDLSGSLVGPHTDISTAD
ncbi:sugar phosphate nucleotidyltransferase [Natribaculum luteum]|uniref:Sugar phosphate nucleotidyltransferase n=1 Tax=Natribaculum luteum TaxID=1586232 RepID=A0ABD5NY89_9EURY|nr:NDP-sugar synthase [Natribaculum luteum]